MSTDPLEQAVLSGALFRDPSAQLNEYREEDRETPSPEPNTDDELGSDLDDFVPEPPASSSKAGSSTRTGPKGVIQDQKDAIERNRLAQLAGRIEGNRVMEGKALLGATWDEEERLKEREKSQVEKDGEDDQEAMRVWREKRMDELRNGGQGERRGFLREVGMDGYLSAVEKGDGWVIVLVYEPSHANTSPNLLPTLQKLASVHTPPTHHFLLASAKNLSFSLLPNGEPDRDVLPTMLVYAPVNGQEAELEHSWIRVDLLLGMGKGGEAIEELLAKNGVIPSRSIENGEDLSEDDDY